MLEHSDQSLSSEEYSALLVDVTQWLEQARKQAGRAVNALMTATYWRIGGGFLSRSSVEESGWAMESGLWNSSPGICRQDSAAGFLVLTCFKFASFTLPTEQESRHRLDNSTFPFLCPQCSRFTWNLTRYAP
jgi:hypothetical protein